MINCWKLSSKATLVVEEIPYLKSAAIGIYIKVGSRHEPLHMTGASHFIEHMLFKGTQKRSAREIAEYFERIGGQLNAATAKEYTCVYARTLDENIYRATDVLFDMLFNSKFSPKDFATEKGVIIEEINMYEDTPDDLIHDVFSQKMWKGHPMGSSILGTIETIESIDNNELYDFYKSCYVPANMVIAVAGNIDSTKIKDAIEYHLEQGATGEVHLEQQTPDSYQPFINLVKKDTEQVQICLGVPGITYRDDNRYTQSVMNNILGGGMSSRLFQTLREELGLAYSVYSFPFNYSDTGLFSLNIGTGPAKIAKFFAALYTELEKFITDGVTDEEVERTQQLIKSNMYLGLESVMNRMNRIGKSILMYGDIIPVEDVINKIYMVDTKKVHNLACTLLEKQELSLAAIGSSDILKVVESEYKKWWK
ncbi:MAG: pitrilysin family protein [Syntrophomonadaceae bacterium]|nr:pitrilysin family protein [Syntrophomonadaceae bacterium]MDD3889019.1 pitrilysin family protein [Syntrophomonadaceae bacterium]MDD4548282.1 pitrilysin family protein [Syntrophomonadaceae bacterium]